MLASIPYRYTKTELNKLLNSMIILIDTREKNCGHIIEYLDNKEIEYKSKALDYGDYSFILPADPGLEIARDLYFNDQICLERKASLEELSGNLAQKRQQ